MKLFRLLYFILFTVYVLYINAQSAPIDIDGFFEDWTASLTTYDDTPESITGVDILNLQLSNDDEYLYVKFELDQEINLTSDLMPHNLWLFLDTDNNEATGFQAQTGYGAELAIKFKDRFAYYNVTPSSIVNFNDLGMYALPTVTSNTFEIAIARNAIPDGINPLFTAATIRVLLKDDSSGDALPNPGDIATYTFDETPVPEYVPVPLEKESEDLIRVMAYNTLFNGLADTDRLTYFERIVKAIQPDIIGFSECSSTGVTYVKNLLDTWMPLETSYGWYVTSDSSADLITASKFPITEQWLNLYRQHPVFIDLPVEYNADLLFTNAHLRCCNANTERQNQVDEYVSFMLDATAAGGSVDIPQNTPFVYAGDLNLVGYAQQLQTLLTGDIQNVGTYGDGAPYDWDGTDVADAVPPQADMRMAYTWKDDGSTYLPGRLDYMLYSDAVMSVEKSFVLQTEIMSTDRLNLYGLLAGDTSNASDHFPIVTDFYISNNLSVSDESLNQIKIYPNPVDRMLSLTPNINANYTIEIYTIEGSSIFKRKNIFGIQNIDLAPLKSGVYMLKVIYDDGREIHKKFIKR